MLERYRVPLTQLPHGEGLDLPQYGTAASAGCDLRAAVENVVILAPGMRALVPTGIAIALPEGTEAQVRPRSGLAIRHGITVLNAPGTIDADYRGEISVPIINLGQEPYTIERGDRIAQLVIAPVCQLDWQIVMHLDEETERGTRGFGSTGR